MYMIYTYNYMIQFICLFVCSFALRTKTTAQDATKLSGIIKWGSRSALHGLKSPILQFLSYLSISSFSFTTDSHFINYHSLDFWLLGSLIRCHPTIEFKLGHCYSSHLPLLTAQILRISLGPTRCRATHRSRRRAALLVHYNCVLYIHIWGIEIGTWVVSVCECVVGQCAGLPLAFVHLLCPTFSVYCF